MYDWLRYSVSMELVCGPLIAVAVGVQGIVRRFGNVPLVDLGWRYVRVQALWARAKRSR